MPIGVPPTACLNTQIEQNSQTTQYNGRQKSVAFIAEVVRFEETAQ
jgi:hypothetical protein